ncbi:MAG: N-6 DNA methylase [Fimbriimonadaceae bacterium]|nr:N-6 DNA methylase [Fimbriimonadaceae bacterium]
MPAADRLVQRLFATEGLLPSRPCPAATPLAALAAAGWQDLRRQPLLPLRDAGGRIVAVAAFDDPAAAVNLWAALRQALRTHEVRWGLFWSRAGWWLQDRDSGWLAAEPCPGNALPGPHACLPGGLLDLAAAAAQQAAQGRLSSAQRAAVAAGNQRLADHPDPAAAWPAVAADLTIAADLPPLDRVQLFEHLLGQRWTPAGLQRDVTARRGQGSFFTPPELAAALVEATLAPLLQAARRDLLRRRALGELDAARLRQPFLELRLLDPAAGGGTFLLAAAEAVLGSLLTAPQRTRPADAFLEIATLRRAVLEQCVVGVEAQPAAARVATAVLQAAGARTPQIHCGDLLQALPAGCPTPHAVVGNPPYLSVKRGWLSPVAAPLRRRFQLARGQWDSYMLFVERALALLPRGGRLGFVLPRPVLANEQAAPLRRLLFHHGGIDTVIDLGLAFRGTAVETVGLLAVAGEPPDEVRLATWRDGQVVSRGSVPSAWIRRGPACRVPLEVAAADRALLAQMELAPARLGDLVTLRRGLELGQHHPAILPLPQRGAVPLLRGRDVAAGRCQVRRWLDPTALLASERKAAPLFAGPKLLLRRVAPRPIAALDSTDSWFLNTLYVLQPRSAEVPLGWLLTVLNSALAARWFAVGYGADERIFPYLRQSQLVELPVPLEPLPGGPAEDRVRHAYGLPVEVTAPPVALVG